VRRVAVSLAAIVAILAIPGPSLADPPRGLTESGRLLWNLEALLHDRFGTKPVYVNYSRGPDHPGNFSTHFLDDARSRYFVYTFAAARHSAFRLIRPATRPKPAVGATGGETPLTLLGAYISCGSGRWLNEHWGSGPENWQINCLRSAT
jgi:hypothetical protein